MSPDPVHELIGDLYPGSSGVPYPVGSTHVAAAFERPHADIIAIIEGLEINEAVRGEWFRPQTDKTVYMTANGFMVVVMSWGGEDGLRIKRRVLRALDDMEEDLAMRRKFIAELIPGLVPFLRMATKPA